MKTSVNVFHSCFSVLSSSSSLHGVLRLVLFAAMGGVIKYPRQACRASAWLRLHEPRRGPAFLTDDKRRSRSDACHPASFLYFHDETHQQDLPTQRRAIAGAECFITFMKAFLMLRLWSIFMPKQPTLIRLEAIIHPPVP